MKRGVPGRGDNANDDAANGVEPIAVRERRQGSDSVDVARIGILVGAKVKVIAAAVTGVDVE